MRQDSNAYIIGFATAVCLVCSIVVSTSAVALRERKDRNKVLDRQTQVLVVAGLLEAGQKTSPENVENLFAENIQIRVIDLATGEYEDSVEPSTYDQRKATKDPAVSRSAPENNAGLSRLPTYSLVYQRVDNGEVQSLILPIEGKGLWSTLYGFIALAPDTTTIQGITFYEHGETPGLGGEVDNPNWKALWVGRRAYDDNWEPSIEVIKGAAGPVAEDPFRVDGLSGSTLTARGVTNLVQFWLGENGFDPYLDKLRAEGSGS
ncbi:MAG: Na(+)-translocating NADH-quinone reductase subunit C [Thermoanaerobaculales bacterium]|nr:Na(+)-translocating NADH-quinone reductase subunit C [Thermoanaerobaculales bacterium]